MAFGAGKKKWGIKSRSISEQWINCYRACTHPILSLLDAHLSFSIFYSFLSFSFFLPFFLSSRLKYTVHYRTFWTGRILPVYCIYMYLPFRWKQAIKESIIPLYDIQVVKEKGNYDAQRANAECESVEGTDCSSNVLSMRFPVTFN